MAEIDIPQSEADALIAMEKHCPDLTRMRFPMPGDRMTIPLFSADKREEFALDVTRAGFKVTKATYQNRARRAIVLMRLDLDGPPHPNPEFAPSGNSGEWLRPYARKSMNCPHLHLYVEGYGDKWAIPAPPDRYWMLQISRSPLKRSCDIVISRIHQVSKEDCSNERRGG